MAAAFAHGVGAAAGLTGSSHTLFHGSDAAGGEIRVDKGLSMHAGAGDHYAHRFNVKYMLSSWGPTLRSI